MIIKPITACVAFSILLALQLPAQEKEGSDIVKVGGVVEVGGRKIGYYAHAGRLALLDDEGKKRADFFHVAYIAEKGGPSRPITFVYNGGPGSASLWLHMGGLGPRRVVLGDEGEALGPAGRLTDNAWSWLDLTDLVFLDPVGTGFSRPAEGRKQTEFSGYKEDIESVGDLIRQLVTHYGRWSSPKYLAGESYGTMRSAGLSGYLQDRHHMFLNGIILISTVLDYGTKRFAPGHDLPYALHLPSYAAAAWYHKRLDPDLQVKPLEEVLREAEEFALGDYLVALARGDTLDDPARGRLADKLARYTGLDTRYIRSADFRVELSRFTKQLLRDEGQTVGRLDSRFQGRDRDSAGEKYEYDPSMANIDGPFSSAINHHLSRTLGYKTDLIYETMSRKVRPWSYKGHENRHLSSADTLRKAMTKNPHLRVMVASGYYDMATPYFAADYTFSHMGLPPELRNNLKVHYYEAGHMMYIHAPSLMKLKQDVSAFFGQER